MAAHAAKAMGAAPAKEKEAVLDSGHHHAKKAKFILAGSSSRSVTYEQAGESASLDVDCNTVVDGNINEEAALIRTDGAMEKCDGRLALQASSSIDGFGGEVGAQRVVGIDYFEASPSNFRIRQYTEIVRQDRGDLKRSWPLAEEYLRGHNLEGRVQVSLWPPIGAGELTLAPTYRCSFYSPEVPLPHLLKLEVAFAECGLSEEKPVPRITAQEVGIEKQVGSHVTSSSDLAESRPSGEVSCIVKTKSSKAGRKITSSTNCTGDGDVKERRKTQDTLQRDSEAKHADQVATPKAGTQRTASKVDTKEVACLVERDLPVRDQLFFPWLSQSAFEVLSANRDETTIQVKETWSPLAEPRVGEETGKGKRLSDASYSHMFQEKKTVDKPARPQVLAENVIEIDDRVIGIVKGQEAANSSVEVEGRPCSVRSNTHVGDSDSNPKRGEREVGDGVSIEKETVVPKRRNEDDRVVEERSTKSDGASASRLSTKRQTNKACPVCQSFSSMSQTTMNVHIDSCLVEHRQEDHIADVEPIESEPEPEPSREPQSRIKAPKSKVPGAKPKRKKRSIADIVANSVTRTLEESPGKEGVKFQGPHGKSGDQVDDSKNLNWVSGNKKKRQPRNVPSRNLKEENETKRRRISRVESGPDESKPAKQEKRRLPEKERERTTKPKQLRVERSTGPSTSAKSSKFEDGGEAESRRSGARKTVPISVSQLPSTRSGPGKVHLNHSNKESKEREVSESVGLSQSRETRTAQEDLPKEMDEIPSQNLDIPSPRKISTSAQENPAPGVGKVRAAKAHLNSGAAKRVAYPAPSNERAPKAPWYPPAAMLRSGTIPHVVVTEVAGSNPIPEMTCGTMKSPGSSLTAENLTDTLRAVPTADTSISTRRSPRSTTGNSNKGLTGSRSIERESPLATDATDVEKASTGEPRQKTSAQGEVHNIAECRVSKEFDDYSDQSETGVEGTEKMILDSCSVRGGSQAVSVESLHQLPLTAPRKNLISEGVGNEGLSKSGRVFLREKRQAADKGQRREERRGSVVPEEESVTVTSSELDATKQDQDPPIRTVEEGCSAVISGDTPIVSVGAGKTSEALVSRRRKRGGLKVKSKKVPEKIKGIRKRGLVGNAGQVEETNVMQSIPSTDVSEETSMEEHQGNEDKLKQENQTKEKKRRAVGSTVAPTFKCISDPVQPDFHDVVVRRIEGMMAQKKVDEQMSSTLVGQEVGVDSVTASKKIVAPSTDQERSKEGQPRSSQVQANSTHKFHLQRSEQTLNNLAQFGRDIDVSTSSSHTKAVTSQVENGGGNAPVGTEDFVQSQSLETWSLAPQRPVGRKKLPIKCAARNVGSANALTSAAKQASGNSSKNNASNQGAKSVESLGTESTEKGISAGDFRVADNTVSPVAVPKPPVSRSRAARQLAKSLPGGKRGALQGEVFPPEGQTAIPVIAVTDRKVEEKSGKLASAPMSPSLEALLSPSSNWENNPVRGQASMTTRLERVSTETFTSKNGTSERTPEQSRRSGVVADDGVPLPVDKARDAHEIPSSDVLHCTETLFGSLQNNTELNRHVRIPKEATTDQLREKGSSSAEVPKDAESGTDVEENQSCELDARLPGSQQLESGFSARRGTDESGLGKAAAVSNVHEQIDKDSRESARDCNPENSLSTIFGTTVGRSERSSGSGLSPGKAVEATAQGKPDTTAPIQTLGAALATFTSGLRNTNLRSGSGVLKAPATSISVNTQLIQGRQNSSNPAVGSTRVSPYRLNTTTTDSGSSQVANVRPVMPTSTATLPTSFTSLLQSTTLPPQSSAALSLAMQGTRPLQEACNDRNELSRARVSVSTRAVTDTPRRSVDGLTWGSEKHAPSSGNDVSLSSHVPAGTAFFRPPPEMGGPSKGLEEGDKEISKLPGWMRAAISDPKGSEPGSLVTIEAEHSLTEAIKGLTGSPEGGEMSGPVRVRLWGRDVVVPPNEKSTSGNELTQQGACGHRNEAQRGAINGNETVASCRTSTACLDGVTVNSQARLKVNLGPAPSQVGQGVAEGSNQITLPVMNIPNSEIGVVVSTEAISVFGKSNNHQAENYLSRLDYNNQRSSYTARSREELRSSRTSKGQASAAQCTTPPEVIIIDDSAESPAKSGDSISGEGLTMAFLLDCGALRYLPSTQNGRSGSQLMEVDPSKIPQRLVNQNFNILAELRKIGLVPAPKAVLPSFYRHSHSLSLEVPHSTPQLASRAGSDVLPPWLLAEKKRKEAQIAENLIVLDDDDEPPSGTVIIGEKRPLNSGASPGGSSNICEQPQSTGQASSSTSAKSGSETRVLENSTGALRTSAMYLGATAIAAPGRQCPATSHAGVHLRRGASSSPNRNERPVAQKRISRKNDIIVSDLVTSCVDKEHVNANTASDTVMREKSGLHSPAASKEQGGVQTASGPSPTPTRRHRKDNRTEKEKEIQGSDLHNEKKRSKAGAHKPGPPAAVVTGQGGSLLKKSSGQGISILSPAWMSGTNGCPKRGAAAQACKQAVERLKARILSSPSRDGASQAGPGALLDFESHMIGQGQEKSTNFGGNLSSASSCLLNIPSPGAQAGFKFSSLSSRSSGDHENLCGSKEAPHNGRGVGQSPTPGTFTAAAVAAERNVSSVSKSPCVPSVAVHTTTGIQGAAQVTEPKQGRSCNPGLKTSAHSGSSIVDGKMSNIVEQSTPVREQSTSEPPSSTFSHLGRSNSSSPNLRSRAVVGNKAVNESGCTGLARGAMQSEQGSLLPPQGTPYSRLPPSRLSLPVHGGSIPTSNTKALLELVPFTSKAAAESTARENSNLQASMEQTTGRTSPQKRIQVTRVKSIGGGKTASNPVSGLPSPHSPAAIITSSSSAQSRPATQFPFSSSPSTSTTDQRRQLKSGVIGAVNMSDGTLVVGLNGSGTRTSRSPASDLPPISVFGRLSQTSKSSQGRYTASAAVNPCDGGTWTLSDQTDEGDQASEAGLSNHSPGSGVIPDYRLPPQIARAMVGHAQRQRATNQSAPISSGFFLSVERPSKQKEFVVSPRSRDSDSVAISVHERYSHTRSTREEKMKDALRESPKFTTTETAEKIRTKSLNSI